MEHHQQHDHHGQHDKHDKQADAQRKAFLLQEAERHRDAIILAKQHIKYGAKPEVIIHNMLDQATYTVRNKVDALLTPTGLSVTAVAPYAIKVLGILRRRGQLKPALGIGAVLAGVAWYINKRRQEHFLAQ